MFYTAYDLINISSDISTFILLFNKNLVRKTLILFLFDRWHT